MAMPPSLLVRVRRNVRWVFLSNGKDVKFCSAKLIR